MPKSFRIQSNSRFDKKAVLWDVVNGGEPPVPFDGLCFTAEEANSQVKFIKSSSDATAWDIEYSTDGTTWTEATQETTSITLAKVGDKVYFRGPATNAKTQTSSNYNHFELTTGKVAASGNVMSLMGNATGLTKNYQLTCLFYRCTSLTTAPEFLATEVSEFCYENTFYKCTSLRTAPTRLPAITLVLKCYYSMFYGCSSLLGAPAIDATILADNSCSYMFGTCSSLETVPKLHSKALTSSCYTNMFANCTSLKVFSQSGEGHDKEWKIPTDGVFTTPTKTQTAMFKNVITDNVGAAFPGTTGTQFTYYTQNEPV